MCDQEAAVGLIRGLKTNEDFAQMLEDNKFAEVLAVALCLGFAARWMLIAVVCRR
jgi:hypothetical protein